MHQLHPWRSGEERCWLAPAPRGIRGGRQPAPLPHHLRTPPPVLSLTHLSETYGYLCLSSHPRTLRDALSPPHSPSQLGQQKFACFFSFLGRECSSPPPGTVSGSSSGAGQTSVRAGRRGAARSPLLLPDQTGTYWKPQPREPEDTHLSKDSDPFKTVL